MHSVDAFCEGTLQPRAHGCQVPLTAIQLRAWSHVLKEGERLSDMRMCVCSLRLLGPLNVAALRESLDCVADRHESLRTRIAVIGDTPYQHIDPTGTCRFERVDLSGLTSSSVEEEARHLSEEFLNEKIDVRTEPLFAAQLVELSSTDHVLLVGVDHLVSDAISCEILSREIWAMYYELSQGWPASLPVISVQFADYAVWQQRTYDAWLVEHGGYWRGRLADAPPLELPFDIVDGDQRVLCHRVLPFPLGGALSKRMRDTAEREGTLLPIVVLAGYVAAAAFWCSQRDFVIAFVSHGRHRRKELKSTVGWLANFLHLRVQVVENDCFLDLLRKVDREFRTARQHEDYDRVPDIIPGYATPLHFNWLSTSAKQPSGRQGPADQIRTRPFITRPALQRPVDASSPKLLVVSSETAAGIVVTVRYRADLFTPMAIRRFGDILRVLIDKCLEYPEARITSALSIT